MFRSRMLVLVFAIAFVESCKKELEGYLDWERLSFLAKIP